MRRVLVVLALAVLGCMRQYGPGWEEAPHPSPTIVSKGPSLVVLGEAGAPGQHAGVVAEHLATVLAAEEAAGREPIVLWVGGNIQPEPGRQRACPQVASAWQRPGVQALAQVVRGHIQRGHRSYAVLGRDDWRCGYVASELQPEPQAGPHPWSMPSPHYVIRVAADGSSRVVSNCSAGTCDVRSDDPQTPALIDLVMIDVMPWLEPEIELTQPQRALRSARMLEALLAALEVSADQPTPPRILVSAVPIEAAGFHGQTGGDPIATFHLLPLSLQHALEAGVFVGVLAGLDHATYASVDVTNAIKRSQKVWLHQPVFQIVSGAASAPAGRPGAGWRRMDYFTSNALLPDAYTPHAGFAVVRVDASGAAATLHAHRGSQWEATTVVAPLRPAPHPSVTPSPAMAPCLRCPEVPVNERQ